MTTNNDSVRSSDVPKTGVPIRRKVFTISIIIGLGLAAAFLYNYTSLFNSITIISPRNGQRVTGPVQIVIKYHCHNCRSGRLLIDDQPEYFNTTPSSNTARIIKSLSLGEHSVIADISNVQPFLWSSERFYFTVY